MKYVLSIDELCKLVSDHVGATVNWGYGYDCEMVSDGSSSIDEFVFEAYEMTTPDKEAR